MSNLITLVTTLILIFSSVPQSNASYGSCEHSNAYLVSATNKIRASKKLAILRVNPKLTISAQKRANEIASTGEWTHYPSSGRWLGVVVVESGYRYAVAGENLARYYQCDQTVIADWMQSPTHKYNIVYPKFREIGVGRNGSIIVIHYGVR